MNTPYERLEDDVRQEWRDNPTTAAFLLTVAQHRDLVARVLIDSVKTPGDSWERSVLQSGGELRALDFILSLPVKGTLRHG